LQRSRQQAFGTGVNQWLEKSSSCGELRIDVLAALRTRRNYRAPLERL